MTTSARDRVIDAKLLIVKQYPAYCSLCVRDGIARYIVFKDVGWLGLVSIISQIGRVNLSAKLLFDGRIGICIASIFLTRKKSDQCGQEDEQAGK
jgi:hypothetical protein